MTEDKPAFLDRPAARLVAASVFVLCCALLAYLHRDDWQAGDGVVGAGVAGEGQGSDPAAACIEQRFSEIDAMIEDGVADEAQAALFKQRAQAMCRSTTDDGGGVSLPAE